VENSLPSETVTPAPSTSLLKSIGPGFVYALTVLGIGDIVSNASAGASYQYHLLWALAMTVIFRFVWVNTSAKYVLVTGESLLAGYGRLGKWVPLMILIALFPIRHFTNQFLILILGSSAHLLFPLPTQWSIAIWACFFTLVGFAMTFWGGYPIIEPSCKILLGIMGGGLLVSALLSHPDPVAILSGTFIPSLPQAQGPYSAMLIVMALIGTEAGSTANLTYAYFISEKGWKGVSYLKQQRLDLAIGVLCLFIMGALLQIAAAGTIHPLGIAVEDPEDLGRIFFETQGILGLIVFGLGLWGAAFSSFIGFNTGYALIVTDICRKFVPGLRRPVKREEKGYSAKRDPIYRWAIIFWSFAPLYIIFTETRAVWLVLMVNAFIVLLIPVLAIPLLMLTNDKSLMGKYKNGWLTNGILVFLTCVAVYFTYKNAVELWSNLVG